VRFLPLARVRCAASGSDRSVCGCWLSRRPQGGRGGAELEPELRLQSAPSNHRCAARAATSNPRQMVAAETRPASALAQNTLTTSTLGTFGLGRDGGHVTPADYFSRSARVPPTRFIFLPLCGRGNSWARGTFSHSMLCTHTQFSPALCSREEKIDSLNGKILRWQITNQLPRIFFSVIGNSAGKIFWHRRHNIFTDIARIPILHQSFKCKFENHCEHGFLISGGLTTHLLSVLKLQNSESALHPKCDENQIFFAPHTTFFTNFCPKMTQIL
jgi:hypothetical protein